MTDAAARETGLAAGIPVLVGGLDAAMAALGAGVTRPGLTQDQGGSAGGFGMSVDGVVVEPRLILSHHVLEGQYLLQAGTTGGGALGWLREVVGAAGTPVDALAAEADSVPPGANGVLFLPYLAGERTPLWSSAPRGVFAGLAYTTTRADLVRAVMEGCAFAVVDNLRLAEARGLAIAEWLGQGGALEVGCLESGQGRRHGRAVHRRPPRRRRRGRDRPRAVRPGGAGRGARGRPRRDRRAVARPADDDRSRPGPPRAVPGAVRCLARAVSLDAPRVRLAMAAVA